VSLLRGVAAAPSSFPYTDVSFRFSPCHNYH
jgi:hypothetical protein